MLLVEYNDNPFDVSRIANTIEVFVALPIQNYENFICSVIDDGNTLKFTFFLNDAMFDCTSYMLPCERANYIADMWEGVNSSSSLVTPRMAAIRTKLFNESTTMSQECSLLIDLPAPVYTIKERVNANWFDLIPLNSECGSCPVGWARLIVEGTESEEVATKRA